VSLRPEYARSLAGWLGMDVVPVREAISRAAAQGDGRAPGQRPPHRPGSTAVGHDAEQDDAAAPAPQVIPRPPAADRNLAVERELLKLTLQQPSLVGPQVDALGAEVWQHPAYAAVATAVAGAGGATSATGGEAWPRAVIAAAANDAVRSLVTELSVEPLRVAQEPDDRYAAEQVARVRERGLTRRIGEIRSRLQRTDPTQQDEYATVFAELIDLEQQRRRLLDDATGTA